LSPPAVSFAPQATRPSWTSVFSSLGFFFASRVLRPFSICPDPPDVTRAPPLGSIRSSPPTRVLFCLLITCSFWKILGTPFFFFFGGPKMLLQGKVATAIMFYILCDAQHNSAPPAESSVAPLWPLCKLSDVSLFSISFCLAF